MSIITNLQKYWNEYQYQTGHRSEAEAFVKSFPDNQQAYIKSLLGDLLNTEIASNPNLFYTKYESLKQFVEKNHHTEVNKGSVSLRSSSDIFGYRPAGSKIWSYFNNPFGVFNYVGQQYAAVRSSTDIIRTAVDSDGYWLVAAEGVSKKRLRDTHKLLSELNLDHIRTELIIHQELFGNGWVMPGYKGNKLVSLDMLYPNRLQPLFNKTTEAIEGYEYSLGNTRQTYKADKLWKLSLPSTDNNQLGTPPLLPAVVMVETALCAQNFNLTLFMKGGLIGHLVGIDTNNNQTPLSTGSSSDLVDDIQKSFQYLYSGSKAGQGIVALPNIHNVWKITDIGSLDTNFRNSMRDTDRMCAQLLGLPPEKINIPRSESAQYQPELVENVINATFDQTINRFTTRTDKFLNKYLMRDTLGITDIKIVPSGRYGAMTLSAAQAIKVLAETGDFLTVNEARTRILGWEPLPKEDPRGQRVLNISAVRKIKEGETEILPIFAPEQQDPDLDSSLKSIGKILQDYSLQKVKCGGTNNEYFS